MVEYCSINDVISITRTNPSKMGITGTDQEQVQTEFEQIITRWIQYATALINDYTRSPLTENDILEDTTKKLIYEDVCSRIVSNRIALSEAYKNYAVLNVEDWQLGRIPENIFDDALKNALDQYKKEEEGIKSHIGITVVTGEDLWK